MDADTPDTLDKVHDAILAAVERQFPAFATVAAYDESGKAPVTPAFFLELAEMPPAPEHDPGTEQLAVNAKFEALIVLDYRDGPSAKREVRKAAAAFAAFARLNRWGCPIGPAYVEAITPDDFNPALDQFEVWRVDWSQIVLLGESVWTNDGVTPDTITAAFEINGAPRGEPMPVVPND